MARKTLFNALWIEQLQAKDWLMASQKDDHAFCKVCSCDINVSQSGITSIRHHMKSQKHDKGMKCKKGTPNVQTFFTQKPKDEPTHSIQQINVMKAEILWVWHSASTSKPFHCEDKSAQLLSAMFPDSKIAANISCGKDKQGYILNFAISPYCRQTIIEEMQNCFFSVAFDEADGRLMIVVRYAGGLHGKIRTEMLDFVPMEGQFTAEVTSNVIYSTITESGLLARNWIGDFSDKCNTMRGKYNSVYF